MATIKSFTSLEQSKKLAEILPLESADMTLLHKEPYGDSDSKFDGLHEMLCIQFIKYDKPTYRKKYRNIPYFPCWSLAALLSVLPKLHKLQHSEEGYYCSLANYKYITEAYNNPVDACYEMIIRLNELNLL